MITLGKNFRNGWANEKKAYVVNPMYPDYFVGRELLEKAMKLLTDMPYNPEDRFTREVGTPEVYTDDAAPGYLTPEDEEKAMKLLSKSREANNGAPLGHMPQACVVEEQHLPVYIRKEDEEKAMKLLEKNGQYEHNKGFTPVVVLGEESTRSWVSPEAREKAMKLLEKDDGYTPDNAKFPVVVGEEAAGLYVSRKAEEEAMKLVSKPDEGLVRRVVGPTIQQTTSEYPIPDKTRSDMELHAKTEQDEYNKKPKLVNGANPQFLVVRYGWYAFAFLLEEGDVRGPELNAKAIQICEAMLTLEGGGEDTELKYHTSYAQQAQRAYRSAHPDTKKALKKFITTR